MPGILLQGEACSVRIPCKGNGPKISKCKGIINSQLCSTFYIKTENC